MNEIFEFQEKLVKEVSKVVKRRLYKNVRFNNQK